MRNTFTNGFYNCKNMISNMLNEGYSIKEISVENRLIKGENIRYIDFFDYICITFYYGDILFIPYEKINYIELEEDDEEE